MKMGVNNTGSKKAVEGQWIQRDMLLSS